MADSQIQEDYPEREEGFEVLDLPQVPIPVVLQHPFTMLQVQCIQENISEFFLQQPELKLTTYAWPPSFGSGCPAQDLTMGKPLCSWQSSDPSEQTPQHDGFHECSDTSCQADRNAYPELGTMHRHAHGAIGSCNEPRETSEAQSSGGICAATQHLESQHREKRGNTKAPRPRPRHRQNRGLPSSNQARQSRYHFTQALAYAYRKFAKSCGLPGSENSQGKSSYQQLAAFEGCMAGEARFTMQGSHRPQEPAHGSTDLDRSLPTGRIRANRTAILSTAIAVTTTLATLAGYPHISVKTNPASFTQQLMQVSTTMGNISMAATSPTAARSFPPVPVSLGNLADPGVDLTTASSPGASMATFNAAMDRAGNTPLPKSPAEIPSTTSLTTVPTPSRAPPQRRENTPDQPARRSASSRSPHRTSSRVNREPRSPGFLESLTMEDAQSQEELLLATEAALLAGSPIRGMDLAIPGGATSPTAMAGNAA